MRSSNAKAPLLGAAFYVALIIPLEFSVTVAGLRLSPYRMFLLIVTVPLIVRLVRENQIRNSDYLMAAHATWAALAL